MKIYDITRPLHPGMATYPGDPPFSRSLHSDLAKGDPCTVSQLSMGAHSGTHLDAPAHFLPQGSTLDTIQLDKLIGTCRIVVKTTGGHVTPEDLGVINAGERILIRTSNSELDLASGFKKNYTALTTKTAQYLVDSKVVLVGIDYLSVEPFGTMGAPVHNILLKANVIILEGLILNGVEAGEYFLAALPLSIPEAEGAPIRAVLLKDWK